MKYKEETASKNINMEIFRLLVKEHLTIREVAEKLNMPADSVLRRFKIIRNTMEAPRGYDYNEDGTLRINEEEAEIIRKAFDNLLKASEE